MKNQSVKEEATPLANTARAKRIQLISFASGRSAEGSDPRVKRAGGDASATKSGNGEDEPAHKETAGGRANGNWRRR
jgi:hypothetical protein